MILQCSKWSALKTLEPHHDKTNKVTCAREDSDQPGHSPSLIRVFAVRMKKALVLSYPLSASEDWSDWGDAHAYLSLPWVHSHFVRLVMRRLIFYWRGSSGKLCCNKLSWFFSGLSWNISEKVKQMLFSLLHSGNKMATTLGGGKSE